MGERGNTVVTQIGLGFLLNVVAGIVVYLFTQNIIYVFITVEVLEVIIIGLIFARLIRRPKLVGIARSYSSFAKGPGLIEITQLVTSEFIFWGISAKTLLSNDEFRDIMLRAAKGNCVFKFLLLNPASPYVAIRAHEEGDTPIGWKNEIEANLERMKQLRNQYHLNIEVRLYNQYPVFRLFIINSNILYFGWYEIAAQGIRSPLLIVQDEHHSLYRPIRLIFNDLWERSQDPYVNASTPKVSESK